MHKKLRIVLKKGGSFEKKYEKIKKII